MCGALADPDCVDREQAFLFGYAVGVVCFEHVMDYEKVGAKALKKIDTRVSPFVQDMFKAMMSRIITPEMLSRVTDEYFKKMLCEEHMRVVETFNEIAEEARVH
jgi:hypothetical protein